MAGKSATGAADKAEMIQSLFDNSSDLMHVVSDRGLHKIINRAWKTVLGWDEADVVGKPAIDFTHPDDREGVIDRFRAMPAGEATERHLRMRAKDGSYLWFAARTQKMPNGEFIGTLRDATAERARADELEETRRQVEALGRRCLCRVGDVRDLRAMEEIVAQAASELGAGPVAVRFACNPSTRRFPL